MKENPLKIIKNNQSHLLHELEEKFEDLWKRFPHRFNPGKDAMSRLRLQRTLDLLTQNMDLKGKKGVDIGCGDGTLAQRIQKKGGEILCLDIAKNALQHVQDLPTTHDAFPKTKLPDDTYDLVLCLELIPELPPSDYRLAMAELSRLVKADGYVLLSTPIDIRSSDALEQFVHLVETEFKPVAWKASYHHFTLQAINFFKAPYRFSQGWKDPAYRKLQLDLRDGWRKKWYALQSHIGFLWYPLRLLFYPFVYLFEQQEWMVRFLESLCKTFWSDKGISHLIVLCKRRPLMELDESKKVVIPDRKPFTKEIVWE